MNNLKIKKWYFFRLIFLDIIILILFLSMILLKKELGTVSKNLMLLSFSGLLFLLILNHIKYIYEFMIKSHKKKLEIINIIFNILSSVNILFFGYFILLFDFVALFMT
ncbi:hypothetical protein WG909_04080 [Peptostreptococcaceae bacterium AGR-M142]